MRMAAVFAAACLLLTGCAPVAREPDDLALVRVLGVDGGQLVALTAVCRGEGAEPVRGGSCGETYGQARQALPWSGPGVELSLTGVSYILIGPGVALAEVLPAMLDDLELGASATLWWGERGAAALLAACEDPAADLALLELEGAEAPTVAAAAAALAAGEPLLLPALEAEAEHLEWRGTVLWRELG